MTNWTDDQLSDISRRFGAEYVGLGKGVSSAGIAFEDGTPVITVTLDFSHTEPPFPTHFEGLPVRVEQRRGQWRAG